MISFGETYRGKRVLVTGHTGFKGSWLALWLDALDAEVCGLALSPTTPSHFLSIDSQCTSATVDVRNADRVRDTMTKTRPQVVFHLAAQALVRPSYLDPKGTFDTNVGGTVNVLEAVRTVGGVEAVVVVTSDKCYENDDRDTTYRECDALGGRDPYSASKGAAEIVAHAYRRSFDGPALATVRAGNVLGGGDFAMGRLVPDCIRALTHDLPITVRNPTSTRPWQHVFDALSGYLWLGARLIEDRGLAGAYNFGPRSDATVISVANAMVSAWGSGEVVVDTAIDGLHEARCLRLDCTRANTLLGWKPVLSKQEMISYTAEWYKHWARQSDMRKLSLTQLRRYTEQAEKMGLPWVKA